MLSRELFRIADALRERTSVDVVGPLALGEPRIGFKIGETIYFDGNSFRSPFRMKVTDVLPRRKKRS